MARPLVVGNGSLVVAFDANMNMRDLYYPYVGQANHIMGNKNRLGVWAEDRFSWCEEENWEKKLTYRSDSLVTDVALSNRDLELTLHLNDAVYHRENVFLRRLEVVNLSEREREVRLFFTHDFSIDESEVGDTAFYEPYSHTVYHYKRNRYFLINGQAPEEGLFQHATGKKRFRGAEGTWRDAEDGVLSNNPVDQGSVDSTVSLRVRLAPRGREVLYYWIAVGRNFQQVRDLNRMVLSTGPGVLLEQVENYWRTWVRQAPPLLSGLPAEVADQYRRSLLLARLHLDRRGAVVASVDSDIMATNRDHYCYLWPRQGAFVVQAFIRAGYGALAEPFFAFCADALTEEGYLLHKYNPDGTVGSTWHPRLLGGRPQLPIQEDETALVLTVLWEYYKRGGNLEFVLDHYPTLVRPAAEFLYHYFDEQLGLPRPSWDLWEERCGIFTFTAAAVHAGLRAAAAMAHLVGDREHAQRWNRRVGHLQKGITRQLFDPGQGRFLRGLVWDARRGHLTPDPTLESSVAGLVLFGVLPVDDPRVVATMRAVEQGLWVRTETGGIARYAGDCYFRCAVDQFNAPGNPWFVTTMWLAQWHVAAATTPEELERAARLLRWAAGNSLGTGVMPEQLDPYSGGPLSVAPLAWSHAAFVKAVLDYEERYHQLHAKGEAVPLAREEAPAGPSWRWW